MALLNVYRPLLKYELKIKEWTVDTDGGEAEL